MARTAILVLTAIFGCKRAEDPAANATKPDRRTRCEAIGKQVTEMGMALAKGLTVGLSEGKASIDPAEEARLVAELETTKVELVAQCMEWPEEALDCFGLSAIGQSAKCERILAAAMGEPVLPEDVPAGPSPSWTHELPHELADMIGLDDGTVVALVEPKEPREDAAAFVVAVKGGKETWRTAVKSAPFALESIAGGPVIAVADREVYAIDRADGRVAWTTRSLETDDDGRAELLAITRTPDGLAVLDDQHRIARLDVAACGNDKDCLRPLVTAKLPDTYGTQWLVVGPNNGWVIIDADNARIFVLDSVGEVRFSLAAHTSVSWARTHGELLRVGMDGAVVVLDSARCSDHGKPIAPVTWPPQKKAKWRETATEREVEAMPTPEGCVKWQADLGVAEDSDPVELVGDDTWVQSGGFLFRFDAQGTRQVRTAVVANSFVIPTGDRLAVVGELGGDEEIELVLTWLAKNGEHQHRSALALGEGRWFLVDDVELVMADNMIVAGLERSLVAFAP